MLQIFPSNNVIYIAAIDEAYALAKEYLDLHGELTLQIKPPRYWSTLNSLPEPRKGGQLCTFLL